MNMTTTDKTYSIHRSLLTYFLVLVLLSIITSILSISYLTLSNKKEIVEETSQTWADVIAAQSAPLIIKDDIVQLNELLKYFGAVELVIADKISIVVVGLLNTRLEDGSKGISLVVIIGVTGLNLALGAGFVLDGIGGMLGIQRTINTDVLREGLRNGTLDSILFPEKKI